MSVIVLGLSHRSAPLAVLERASLDPAGQQALLERLLAGENVDEPIVLSTCNRVEVYADATTFHGAVTEIGEALAAATGVGLGELREHLYVHFDERAVAHLFNVAAGLDSLAVGESQILAQLRESLREGQRSGRIGPVMSRLVQQALRVGKRVHSETGIDTVSRSLVERALDLSGNMLGDLTGVRAVVVGAGAMSSLATHTLVRHGLGGVTVVNRTFDAARRLADAAGCAARPIDELPDALAAADLVVSCTGAVGHVIDATLAARANPEGRPQVYVDLALPRDVADEVSCVRGVAVLGLGDLGPQVEGEPSAEAEIKAVQDLVTSEVAAYVVARRAERVAPTVAALRANAADIVAAELSRLDSRVDLDETTRAQVQLTVHRVVEKLLHTPTVRVKELASQGGAVGESDYAAVLSALFDLDPAQTRVVTVPPEMP